MKYRSDIDGLRAIAVLPVILYHADMPLFHGGYVGVDVFFVISGFLISGILITEIGSGQFSLYRFYERRARRILPALFAMLFVSIPFAVALMLPSQLQLFSSSIIAILLFCSNVLFWKRVDYFAAPAEENPLLHTWSLGVEEQFYLVFPLLLWGLWKLGRKSIIGLILVLSLASLGLAEWACSRYPAPNFYLLPTRAWELGLGALAAFWSRNAAHRPNPPLALLGLAMILAAILLYSDETPFPSLYALLPVLGAVLVLLFGAADSHNTRPSLATRILSTRPLVFVGLISYSAYLWHQPVFAFARMARITPPPLWLMALLTTLSLVIAWLSWRYVEQPFRRSERRWLQGHSWMFAGSAVGMLVLGLLGWIGLYNHGFNGSWQARHADQPVLLEALNYRQSNDRYIQFFSSGCFFSGNESAIPAQFYKCMLLDYQKPNYLLIGDSFAAQYAKALTERYPEAHLLQVTISGCRPVWNGRGRAICTQFYENRLRPFIIDHAKELRGVLIAAHWSVIEAPDLKKTVLWLRDLGIPVAIVGPSPEYGSAFPALLLKAEDYGVSDSTNAFSNPDRWSVQNEFRKVAQETGVKFLPILDYLCTSDRICQNYSDDGYPMIFDYGHFTLSGMRSLIKNHFPPMMSQIFSPSESSGVRP